MMKKRVFCFLLTVFIICAFSVNSFAFGQFSFSDSDMQTYKYSNIDRGSSSSSPGYHIVLKDGREVIEKVHTVKNASVISSSVVYAPVVNCYYYVIKQDNFASPDTRRQVSGDFYGYRWYVWSLRKYRNASGNVFFNITDQSGDEAGTRFIGRSADGNTPSFNWNLYTGPYYFWFNSYFYIFIPVTFWNGSNFDTNVSKDSLQQYSSVKYSEMKQEELDSLSEASGIDDLAGVESLGGMSASTDDLGGETTTIINEVSESEKYSEEFSKIDEMISNLDDFSSVAMSNYGEVSAVLGQVRGGIDEITGWLPKIVWALAMLGLIVIVAVKIIGR